MSSCSHHGHHHPVPTSFHGAFALGILLNAGFVAAEMSAGFWAHSLALIADAVHNLGDVLGLAAAWLGYHFSNRRPSAQFTAGLGRMSIYTTILNGLLLVVSSFWIIVESVQRLQQPLEPATGVVIGVAVLGIVINLGTAWGLSRGQHDINIKGAMLHMLGDAAISVAVAVAAALIAVTGWLWLDPAVSIAVALLILWTSWPLLREGLSLAMDGVPQSIKTEAVRSFIEQQPQIKAVHDLRIWALSTTKTALSAHIVLAEDAQSSTVLGRLHHDLQHEFDLASITLQLEQAPFTCIQSS